MLCLIALLAHAAPQLVTPQLPPAVKGERYAASLMIGSALPLTSATVSGLPGGMIATHNGSGSVAIAGTPAASGNFSLAISATDNAANALNASVNLTVVQVSDNVTAVAAGEHHTCVVIAGGVQCWGDNRNGQLGNNSTTSSLVPVQAIAVGSNVVAVSANRDYTCAVANGGVQCWGYFAPGSSVTLSLVPVQMIAVGSGVTALSAGLNHSCAVVNGGAQCWGGNFNGQLGDGTTISSLTPVQAIAAGSNVSAVAAGIAHSCAAVNGGAQCWGDNTNGQLGNDSTVQSLIPVQAIAAGSNVIDIAANNNVRPLFSVLRPPMTGGHTCAVVNGGVQCWGNNFDGQLGNATTTQSLIPVQAIAAGSNASAVKVGGRYSCALVNGGVQCWGGNAHGQLGNGTNTQSLVPVVTIAAGSNVTAIAVGGVVLLGDSNDQSSRVHTCAVVNGRVKCWGSNGSGQLGNNRPMRALTPVPAIAAGRLVTAVSALFSHTCAVVNGGVQCWGFNSYGQLGNNTTKNSFPVVAIPAGSSVTSVSAGANHSCAVVNAGVQCWGANANYVHQLGNNRTTQSQVPSQTIAAGSVVTAASAGGNHSCAVVNGGVQCWGYSYDGALGNGSQIQTLIPVQAIAYGSDVTAVAAGSVHSCAVISGGVQCWGTNNSGQLGNGSTTISLIPTQTIGAGSNVASVSAGGAHSCVVANGGVQCWGANADGQLGNNSTANALLPGQVIATGSGVTAVAAGGSHTCALASGGVMCWGRNDFGQLGNNSTTPSLVPVQIIAPNSNVTSITAGFAHSCAVVNGGVVCWGKNEFGQLADAYSGLIFLPVAAMTVSATLAGAPTIGSATAGNAQATINFVTPLANGSAPVASYTATCLPGAISASGFASPITVTGLTNDVRYTCAVTANNAVGAGPASASVSVTPSATIPLTLIAVQSRKTHGSAGTFDLGIDTALAAPNVTVEPRTAGNGHLIVFQFSSAISEPGTVSVTPTGSASVAFSRHEVLVTLANMADSQRVTLSLSNVNGGLNPAPVSIGFLVGDVNNSRTVNASDISGVKARAGQTVDAGNFKFDINASGGINSSDISAVKARSGLVLP